MRSQYSTAARKDTRYGKYTIDADWEVTKDPYYVTWRDLTGRCEPRYQVGKLECYIGCSIHPEWWSYVNFKEWADQFEPGLQLDKDIKVRGNKVYGPDTCLLVPQNINKAFQMRKSIIGFQGVKERPNDKWCAYFRDPEMNWKERARHFDTPEKAHQFWQRMKAIWLEHIVEPERVRQDVREAVINRARLLRFDADNGIITGDYL